MKRETTSRGFAFWSFQDSNGEICSLQKSSSAMEDKIWLGADDIGLKVFRPGQPEPWEDINIKEEYGPQFIANNRMHLNREQVKALIPVLQRFVDTGEITI